MRFNRKPITVEEAQALIQPYIKEGTTESVPILESDGKYLAEAIEASHPIPHFRRSGMDGFAVRAEDLAEASKEHPIELQCIEEIPAGTVAQKTVTTGTCSRIMTGAAVPEGADAVVKLEDTEANGATTLVYHSPAVKENVTGIGEEMAEGTPIMEKGRKIGPGEVALLATFGHAVVKVFQQPRVAILSTGSELLGPGDALEAGKIRNSNTYMLYAQVKRAGAVPVVVDSVPDDIELAKRKISEALANYDAVITTGGVSVGDYDILTDFFAEWDGKLLFNKLKMRPGSPTSVGVKDNRLLFALSGNPGACFAGFELFVRPVLRGMLGKDRLEMAVFEAYMAESFINKGSFPRFVRAKLLKQDGKICVQPVGVDKSSIVTSIKDAEVLIHVPEGPVVLQAEDLVTVTALKDLD
ncbi:MAG TPA: gephyrin-like molybdotransferase Glp [Bacillales bacterium]|nr:gephyrin-like molybdotransferase Glp [Bacillales bacterium]